VQIQSDKFGVAIIFAAALCFCLLFSRIAEATPEDSRSDSGVLEAVCQVVYPVDQFPSEQGYRYIFFGNGFFVNEEGYVVTAAHLLSWFHDGAVPSILVGPAGGPRQVFEATVVAMDEAHDVAVLRATRNPFQTVQKIAYLPLSADSPARGRTVITASMRPADINDAHSSDIPLVDLSRGEVLDYRFYREEEGMPGSELLLFDQQVVPGQSGSPLVSPDSNAAVGIVLGRWLHPSVVPSGATGSRLNLAPGAALRVHYAISLLDQLHVRWHAAAEPFAQAAAAAPAQQAANFSPAAPISVVTTPYPPLALYGGEVVLDALIDSNGNLSDLQVVSGDSPFLETVMGTVQNWTFQPARMNGRAIGSRIGVVFNFPQSFLPRVTAGERKYEEPLAGASDRGALPIFTIEPPYPVNSIGQGSVVLYDLVDSDGKVTSASVVQGVPSLTAPSMDTVKQWEFVPGKQGGAKTDSAVIVVVTFRRPTT
jgi:outer membrane biosynthesis protein TonB